MIKYVKGNLLDAEQVLIIHQCNAQDTMGSGVAKAIKDRYRQAYEDYISYFKLIPKEKRMGLIQITKVNDKRSVCNLIGQLNYLPRGQRHTSYDALTKGFEQVKSAYIGDIAMPKIGCGLGGGNWNKVSEIIERVFDDRDIYIYEL